MPLGLIPEILDAIDVRLPICEQLGVVDSVVPCRALFEARTALIYRPVRLAALLNAETITSKVSSIFFAASEGDPV
jgi:hypothetical protein